MLGRDMADDGPLARPTVNMGETSRSPTRAGTRRDAIRRQAIRHAIRRGTISHATGHTGRDPATNHTARDDSLVPDDGAGARWCGCPVVQVPGGAGARWPDDVLLCPVMPGYARLCPVMSGYVRLYSARVKARHFVKGRFSLSRCGKPALYVCPRISRAEYMSGYARLCPLMCGDARSLRLPGRFGTVCRGESGPTMYWTAEGRSSGSSHRSTARPSI
jgi:hypothetical protein